MSRNRGAIEANDLRPVFLVGVGRSGSTLLHRLLALHPRAAWLSGLAERYPHRSGWNRALLRGVDLPLVGGLLRERFRPGECYGYWDRAFRGFRRPFRDLVAADATPRVRPRIRAAISELPTGSRQVPVLKITGWPRLGFLHRIFPEARFVHLVRDGRAVAASLSAVSFWRGWQGPSGWRWGPLPPEYDELWRSTDRSFPALAGLQWRLLLDAWQAGVESVPESHRLEVRYEDLCQDPRATLDRILTFSGLGESSGFDRRIDKVPIASANDKWSQQLEDRDLEHLNRLLAEPLRTYGYDLAL